MNALRHRRLPVWIGCAAEPQCNNSYRLEPRGPHGTWQERTTASGLSTVDEVGVPGRESWYRVAATSGGGYSPIASVRTYEREHWLPVVGVPSVRFNDVQFVDDRVGYACGNEGVLLKTSDAGGTWSAVAFADSSLGIVTGTEGLWVTRDGCRSWTHAVESTSLTDCAFASRETAVAVGNNGQILRTTDSGVGWVPLPGMGWYIQAIVFADSTHGWLCGRSLLATTDAGESWTAVDVQGGSVEWYLDLAHSPDLTLLVAQREGVLRIADGSCSWLDLEMSPYGDLAVAYASPRTAFTGSWLGFYRSVDDGLSWQPVSWSLLSPAAIAFASPSTGVAVGEPHDAGESAILRTTDGGAE